MNKKTYFLISGLIFGVVAVTHLLRIINQLPVVIGNYVVPMAGSVIGLIVAGILSYFSFKFKCQENKK